MLYQTERNNSGGCLRSRRCFRKFVNNHRLIDIPMSGGCYTWTNSESPPILVRLDRFVFTAEWEERCISLVQYRLRRPISDHTPILLDCNAGSIYRPPFRFENYYLSHPDFLVNMRVWWDNLTFFGSPSFILAKKLQALKFFIKKWGRKTFGSLQLEVDNLEKLIDVYDSLEEINALNEDDFVVRETTKVKHNQATLNLARKWHARSKGQWLANGERNSKFFHKNASYNQKVNSINSLIVNGEISHDKKIINEEARRFYENVFTENVSLRPTFDNPDLPSISIHHNIMLEKPFEEKEIRKVIWGFGTNKSPGLDGYTMEFFKAVWGVIKVDLMAVMKEFETTGRLYWRLNCTNIVLIPKCDGAISMHNFRPISLIGGIYKTISKILT